jgi:NADH-quinone oxidoreductase subunit J
MLIAATAEGISPGSRYWWWALVLAFVAYRLLTQHRQGTGALAGILAAVFALTLGWLTLLRPATDWTEGFLFFLFAAVAVVAGLAMLLQHNPVYAALWFAIVVMSTAGLFLLQSAPFLAAATVIVYAGAIIVTFLFVIMLAQQSGLAVYDRTFPLAVPSSLAGCVLLGSILYATQQAEHAAHDRGSTLMTPSQLVEQSLLSTAQPTDSSSVTALGRSLFGDYLWSVEIAGALLLLTTAAAIVIAGERREART